MTRRLIRYEWNGTAFYIDSDRVDGLRGVDRMEDASAEDHIAGWMNVGGIRAPVYWPFLERDRTPEIRGHEAIVVVRHGGFLGGVLVDKAGASRDVPDTCVFPVPAACGDAVTRFASVVVENDSILLELSCSAPRVREETFPPRHQVGQAAAGGGATCRVLTFSLRDADDDDGARFALCMTQILEVGQRLAMAGVPEAPPSLLGIASWRTTPIPVVDLACWLGMEQRPLANTSRILICRGIAADGGRLSGLLGIAGAAGLRMRQVPFASDPWPAGVPWNDSRALGVYQADQRMLVVPDIDQLLRA
ncbi:MAG: chemotaxis protein CheW [Candidatus Solibacter usitatus]|nr:chemotaxis protein CheW [Candidatus Solibacter usitatus]